MGFKVCYHIKGLLALGMVFEPMYTYIIKGFICYCVSWQQCLVLLSTSYFFCNSDFIYPLSTSGTSACHQLRFPFKKNGYWEFPARSAFISSCSWKSSFSPRCILFWRHNSHFQSASVRPAARGASTDNEQEHCGDSEHHHPHLLSSLFHLASFFPVFWTAIEKHTRNYSICRSGSGSERSVHRIADYKLLFSSRIWNFLDPGKAIFHQLC